MFDFLLDLPARAIVFAIRLGQVLVFALVLRLFFPWIPTMVYSFAAGMMEVLPKDIGTIIALIIAAILVFLGSQSTGDSEDGPVRRGRKVESEERTIREININNRQRPSPPNRPTRIRRS